MSYSCKHKCGVTWESPISSDLCWGFFCLFVLCLNRHNSLSHYCASLAETEKRKKNEEFKDSLYDRLWLLGVNDCVTYSHIIC